MQSVQLADGKAELLLPLDDGLKDGQQLRPLRADLDARAIAREQRDVPMLLQVRDHAAHGRLRVAQLRGGLCDAAGLDGLEVGQIFVDMRSLLACIGIKAMIAECESSVKYSILECSAEQ